MIGGQLYTVCAWSKISAKGVKWQSLSFAKVEDAVEAPEPSDEGLD